MTKYVPVVKGWLEPALSDNSLTVATVVTMTVFEGEKTPRKTGLLDSSGNELVAITETKPIGFITR